MIINYFKTAFRNFYRQKGYSFINIAGLAIGFASFILIMLFILNEFSYDKFHKDHERIYRIAVKGRMSGDFFDVAVSPAPLAPALKTEFPDVEEATRIRRTFQTTFFIHDEKKYYERGLLFADTGFFKVFSFRTLQGDPERMLKEPFSIVLTEKTARKYFGEENPLGKILKYNDQHSFTVTGVIRDVPTNSHFTFPMLASWSSQEEMGANQMLEQWGSMAYHTYVKLMPQVDTEKFDEKIHDYILSKMIESSGGSPEDFEGLQMEFIPYLQPLTSIHLHSNKMAELGTNGDISYVITFSLVAVFILIIACINFMNLTTARSSKRAKEVGIRKVHGAHRMMLIRQFLIESTLLSLTGLLFSFLIVELAMPVFNDLIGEDLSISFFERWDLIMGLLLVGIIVGLLAGSYPAFYLSSFQPVRVLKGDVQKGPKRSLLRNTLVVLQFTISISLLIGTGIIYAQLSYIQNKNLGFDKENILVIPLRGNRLQENHALIQNKLKTLPEIKSVSSSFGLPGQGTDGTAYFPEGKSRTDPWLIFNMSVDYEFLETMGMELIKGRSFDENYATDTAGVVINETLWKKLGWGEDVLNKKFRIGDPDSGYVFHVIGVVQDFHNKSLHDPIDPFIFYHNPGRFSNIVLKLNKGNVKKSIERIEEKWNEMEASFPFDFYFFDQSLDDIYKREQKMGETFIYFSIIAILIACLGLFGLASYTAEQRTKEIGIRKTLGSSSFAISMMLTREFTKWVLVANIIAWPLSFYLLWTWLSNFAYSIDIFDKWWLFVTAALLSLLIAVLTVLYQALKAANANPVDALKYE
ncbi:MAG: ABC transporter permease [Bacteroidales bacterium]|nr:ABC transporter permease [Bacteroidales bacterium]MCF8387759.1 ABC transporter permease [Bacteroidales bacterium]MCF8397161.1 ABC transporter permease [Bacteroidales bacterium]